MKTAAEHARNFTTISGTTDRPAVHRRRASRPSSYARDLNDPGEFPYTRGIHASGYDGKLWTMRQFAGFGTPEDTNARYKALLAAGGTGLSVAFDLPTLMGRDPDHPLALGEVGKCGVSVTSLADMETLFDGISLADITTSMTINSPAAMIFAMYLVVAEQQGADWQTLSGTIQNDILKEYIAQKEYIFPPRPSMRIIADIFAFCAEQVPRWNTISVSGYHIREAGSTALQELAFTLRDGLEYVQWGVDAGLAVDDFVPRMSFFFNAHSDFFEEIAKYRAARSLWAHAMRERFGAKRRAVVEAAVPQPDRRRLADRAAAVQQRRPDGAAGAVGRGSAAPTRCTPTRSTRRWRCRPRRRRRSRCARSRSSPTRPACADVVDPLGGSYFVEKLTRDMEDGARGYFDEIDRMGGMVAAIEAGFPAAGDRRELVPVSAGGRGPGEDDRRRQRLRRRRRAAGRDAVHRRGDRRAAAGRSSRRLRRVARRRPRPDGARCAARSRARPGAT